jgi:hypothetical protein
LGPSMQTFTPLWFGLKPTVGTIHLHRDGSTMVAPATRRKTRSQRHEQAFGFRECRLPMLRMSVPLKRGITGSMRRLRRSETWSKADEHPCYVTQDGTEVWMYRKGERVGFFDRAEKMIGPAHANMMPAASWAFDQGWWDPRASQWLNDGCQAGARGEKVKPDRQTWLTSSDSTESHPVDLLFQT